ncbi:NAD-dependent epimerase/dehydratase family protein [Lutimonas zeaxanthinifaciens]|uniref:NAD-dependent epimerase/dehydratase family protein n=1 Tax=Lutimonas zeaxanthinifaciens TaxID=3060215 RepID=UPI00265D18BB|nr:NAD-dependent epimerase/dehydratase family protein [Lutimonas sp. YSD2104]WKK66049.1 NAD-dependent epimerase/dehydratase family protein [Lutimonas sp. YSD2104]
MNKLPHKTVAVTGSTGHLGTNLIKHLLDRNFRVKALIRKGTTPWSHPQLDWVQGDLLSLDSLSKLIQDCNYLVHCASAISVGEGNHDLIYRVNVEGTRNLLNCCLNSDIRFAYISSSTATEDVTGREIFDESRPYREDKSFYYAWTKARAEELVLDYVDQKKLDAYILRPTAILGPEDPQISRFGRTILDMHRGELPFITSGGYNMVDVRDLCKTIENSLTKATKGSVYLTGGHYITLRELSKIANPKKTIPVLSVNLLLKLLPVINFYDKLFPLRWPVNKESLMTLKNAPKNMNCIKAQKELGHSSRPVKESVEALITWFQENNIK